MEDTPREMELNFDNRNEAQLEELDAVREELARVVSCDEVDVNGEAGEAFPVSGAEKCDSVTVGKPEQTSLFAAGNDSMLSSRCPANRPGGTPPLRDNSRQQSQMSAMEMAVAGKSYGTALRILREQHNISYKELEQLTNIQPHFLVALENEKRDALPLVYVIAFVRTLCRFYKLSEITSNAMVKDLKEQLEYSCNDELMNTLDIDRSGAAVNEKRLKRIITIMIAGVVGIIALVVFLAVIFTSSGSSGQEAIAENPAPTATEQAGEGAVKFDPDSRYLLLEAPVLDLPKLPVAQ